MIAESTQQPTVIEADGVPSSDRETRREGKAKNAPAKLWDVYLSPPQADDELGRLGPYRVLKPLGTGGMGVVFQAEDPQLKRFVALKAVRPIFAADDVARARFLREAQAAAAVKHDHIVTIYQVGEDRGIPFLAMEYLEGEALDARLNRAETMPMAEIVRIGREIAEGLAAAHERGLIHRDIKPANIWLEGRRGRVKILDFGLARAVAEDTKLTQTGTILGTPAYMAPEQARAEKVDARCDLFSLGCILYQMCTGELPFKGRDTMSVLMALAADIPTPCSRLRADIPPQLSDSIEQLLAKDPDERPGSAETVAEILSRIEQSKPAKVRPPEEEPRKAVSPSKATNVRAKRSRQNPSAGKLVLLSAAGTILLLLLGVGIFLLVRGRRDARSTNRDSIADKKTPFFADAPAVGLKAPQWISLFNGKDLTGWEALGVGKWSVAGGILKGDDDGGRVGWLASTRSFADLELELEYRLPVAGNSGVYLRANKEGAVDGSEFIEIQLLDDPHYGPRIPLNMHSGAVFKQIAPRIPPHDPPERWYKLRIRVEKKHVQVWLNNVSFVDGELQSEETSGLLGLQLFRTPVEFRNIRVRELRPPR